MKKVLFNLILIILVIFMISCDKEYDGVKITSLSFNTIDYNGGSMNEHVIDFNENVYKTRRYMAFESTLPQYEIKREFTEEEEKEFINGIYNSGLLSIDEKYSEEGIVDGGGWHLIIDYEDETVFESSGSNAAPSDVFNKCSTYFYDLCKEEVLGVLPEHYINPPEVSYSFRYVNDEGNNASDNSLARFRLAKYKWNKSSKGNGDYYLINNLYKKESKFTDNSEYKLVLYTANYHYKEKFNKCELREYNFDKDLTGEEVIYKGHWFEQIEIEISLNKIYVFRYSYKDGDYAEYTFNTFVQKDEYQLNVHDKYNVLGNKLPLYYEAGETVEVWLGFRSGPRVGLVVDGTDYDISYKDGLSFASFIMPNKDVTLYTYLNELNEYDCGDYNHTWVNDDRLWYKHKCEVCGKVSDDDKPDSLFFSLNEAYKNGYISYDDVVMIAGYKHSGVFNPVEIDPEIEKKIVSDFCKENGMDVNVYPGSVRCFGVYDGYYAVMVDGCGLMYLQWLTKEVVAGVVINYGSSQHILIWKEVS